MPYLGSTVFFLTLVGGLALAMSAWWLAWRSLAPRFVQRCREGWTGRPVLTVLLGGVVGGVVTLVGVGLSSVGHPLAKLLGAFVLTALLALSLAGTTGLAARIGGGLASPSDEGREWFQTLKGGVVLELVFLLPLVGWFVALPFAVYGGLGAALQAILGPLLARRPTAVAAVVGSR